MNKTRRLRIPSYRHHKPSGQAVVTLDGRDFYLGRYGTDTSRQAYARLLGEWQANTQRLPTENPAAGPTDLTINELIAAYWEFAKGYYVKNRRPTSEQSALKSALCPLRKLYGPTPAATFGPLGLKTVRQAMIASGWCRRTINKNTGRIKAMFRWAVENELVPAGVYHGLQAVAGLRRGRSAAREPELVRPVPEQYIKAVCQHVSRQVKAMIEVQDLTGMRPGEVVIMRGCDLDTTGRVWLYTPAEHKTEHHDRDRVIALGPRTQAVIRNVGSISRRGEKVMFKSSSVRRVLFVAALAVVGSRDKHLDACRDEESAENVDDPGELTDELCPHGDHDAAHDQGAHDTPEEDAVLVHRRHREEREDHGDDPPVRARERRRSRADSWSAGNPSPD